MRAKMVSAMLCAIAMGLSTISVAQAAGAAKGPHASLPCSNCHIEKVPSKAPDKAACLKCHGSYGQLAKKTEKLNPAFNPHYSHKGQEQCASCHSMHAKSQFICNDCHGFTGPGTEMK